MVFCVIYLLIHGYFSHVAIAFAHRQGLTFCHHCRHLVWGCSKELRLWHVILHLGFGSPAYLLAFCCYSRSFGSIRWIHTLGGFSSVITVRYLPVC